MAQAIRATELIKTSPDKAAPYVNAVLGGGLVREDLMAAALRSPAGGRSSCRRRDRRIGRGARAGTLDLVKTEVDVRLPWLGTFRWRVAGRTGAVALAVWLARCQDDGVLPLPAVIPSSGTRPVSAITS